ncbi:MAG: hypothetical protein ACKOBW_02245 [Planctomycetota bacterium]
MIERRHQWLLDCWTLVAKQRATRPDEYASSVVQRATVRCPFCRGHEADTLESLSLYGASADPDRWDVRVTPNKFPALQPFSAAPDDEATSATDALIPASPYAQGSTAGVHELVIESPEHCSRFSDLTEDQARFTAHAWRDRLRQYATDPRLAYGLVFRNSGLAGGASLEHVHSQIICTPWIPSVVRTELRQFQRWRELRGGCVLCAMVREELQHGRRFVAQTSNLLAFCPYASRFAWETWIVPRQHASCFEQSSDELTAELGQLLRQLLPKIEGLAKLRGYNLWIHTAPFATASASANAGANAGASASAEDSLGFHWHLEIAPRTTGTAGFETGGGDYIISISPEDAADYLRLDR